MKRPLRSLQQIIDECSLATPEEVANAITVSIPSIYAWAKQGFLPCIKITDQTIRFDPIEIVNWIKSKSNGENKHNNFQYKAHQTHQHKNKQSGRLTHGMNLQEIAAFSKEERVRQLLTQEDLATKTGISIPTILKIQKRRAFSKKKQLELIADVLKINITHYQPKTLGDRVERYLMEGLKMQERPSDSRYRQFTSTKITNSNVYFINNTGGVWIGRTANDSVNITKQTHTDMKSWEAKNSLNSQ